YKEYEKAESKEMGRFFEPDEIIINPFGLKIIKILNKKRSVELWNISYRREHGEWNIDFKKEFKLPFVNLFEKGTISNTLIRNTDKFTSGTYTFKISLDRSTWCKIKLSGDHTLEDLYNSIQEAFDFDNDHMYSFFMDGKAWSNNKFTCPYDEEGPYVDEVKIGKLNLYKKQEFLYIFDYGDDWRFNVKVFKIDEKDKVAMLKPQIVESKGKVEQYPDFDDEW
ncbi:MAG: Plasmid pRiA4b ORF-3-like protein, partial [Clostridiaceae bacterium]|nr:Plasmid pRiA4b ORF-3-like protein [Clostridiaceae bacterium]